MIVHRQQSSRGYRLTFWINRSSLRVLFVLILLMPATANNEQTTDPHSEVAKLLSQLEWERLHGEWERVDAAYRKLESTHKLPDDLREDILSRHATVLLEVQQLDEAAILARAVMATAVRRTGRSSPETAFAQTLLAKVLIQQGLLKEAGKLLHDARTAARAKLGSKHLDTSRIETTYAALLAASGKLHDAERILRDVEDLMSQILDKDNLELATVRFNLGFLYFSQRRFAPAEAEFQSACRSLEKVVGPNSTYYIHALNYLVQVQWQMGELRQAEALQKRALLLSTSGSLPTELAHALMNQARIETERGAFNDAERNARKSLVLTTSHAFESQTSLIDGVTFYRRLLQLQGNQADDIEWHVGLNTSTGSDLDIPCPRMHASHAKPSRILTRDICQMMCQLSTGTVSRAAGN